MQLSEEAVSSILVPSKLIFNLTTGPCSGSELSSKSGYSLTVGRTRSSKIHIKDSSISEKHAVVSWNGTAWILRDMGSSNGTALNGRALQPMVDVVVLKEGDEILFGLDSTAVVKLEARTLRDLTVEQLLASLCEAAACRVEARGQAAAKELLTELGQAKAMFQVRLGAAAV